MEITKDIRYIGVDDTDIDLFEGQYPVENGMSYNSYVILDEKIAVLDSVDAGFVDEWLDKLAAVLDGRLPDYLIVQHMEPDHSAGIARFMEAYPEAVIVSSMPAFNMVKNYFGTDYAARRMVIKEGSTLSLGNHELRFIGAPMVHWPEVMMTYDASEKILFTADAFGKFGTVAADEEWLPEARRYYIGIVGKFGVQVQNLLKKAVALDIQMICPLHGPILTENLGYYVDLYQKWSSYTPEQEGVCIAYASVYGHTAEAAELLAQELIDRGCPHVVTVDLTREDVSEAVQNAFCYSKLVLCSVTYNAGLFPAMQQFITQLVERNFQNRTVAFVENGSWAPTAGKAMKTMLENCKNITFAEHGVTIRAALNEDSRGQIAALAEELAE
ncbi:MAG: FprA family A-type flavoprotein [Clostridiales bacterium]|nr:FprA family A-type flavoprotein [Clostridiales bacterium]